jgi:hypothetical protein
MMSITKYWWILLLMLQEPALQGAAMPADKLFTDRRGSLVFEWNLTRDSARVMHLPDRTMVWQGSLLPSFWLVTDHQKRFVKTRVTSIEEGEKWILGLQVGTLGHGQLIISREDGGIRFSQLEIDWLKQPPAIIEMYFGASDEAVKKSAVWPTWDRPFMPDWQSLLYCVPGAKGGTSQSYFRMWDFGLANVALGNFGPSMGAPYGAAYPRPLLYAGMGSDAGFVALGAGSLPDAAMSLRVQSTRGCFQYVYDEDIWGALPGNKRTWKEPLRICLGENAWTAFKEYYGSFPARQAASTPASKVIWNTWGMWGQKKYLTRPIADFAKNIGADILVMDDPWESSQGSGIPNLDKFPHFEEDIAYARKQNLAIGLWESVGWIKDPFSHGLKNEDLILDRTGRPCKANWDFDPSGESYYCLDISSARVREFIKQRTLRIMQTLKPALLKLDFMYGLPAPYMGVPRDPQYRGERYGDALVHLIVTTAKSVNPGVIIQGYGIGPLALNDIDMVSMDDQGDLWYDIPRGHQQWSMWGSLLSDKHVTVCGSSGYTWQQDDEVVLNSCILGPPGAVLPIYLKAAQPVPDKYFNRRLAIDRWYRRTLDWTPVWLNSDIGGYATPPQLNCWGRMEKTGEDPVLTALVLRDGDTAQVKASWMGQLKWKGRWALISQDDKDIFSTSRLALIPFDTGTLSIAYPVKPAGIIRLNRSGSTAYDQWEWADGWLTIKVSEGLLEQTAGFLVSR